MAVSLTFTPTTEDARNCITAKLGTGTVAAGGNLKDADIGKPLKFAADGRMVLCADGDNIDGFLVSVESWTNDGYAVGTVQIAGCVRVTCSGAVTYHAFVEAAAPAAAGTAETSGYGAVSAHTAAATDPGKWMLIGGTGGDGTNALVMRV